MKKGSWLIIQSNHFHLILTRSYKFASIFFITLSIIGYNRSIMPGLEMQISTRKAGTIAGCQA